MINLNNYNLEDWLKSENAEIWCENTIHNIKYDMYAKINKAKLEEILNTAPDDYANIYIDYYLYNK